MTRLNDSDRLNRARKNSKNSYGNRYSQSYATTAASTRNGVFKGNSYFSDNRALNSIKPETPQMFNLTRHTIFTPSSTIPNEKRGFKSAYKRPILDH